MCDGANAAACIAGCDFDCVCVPCPEELSVTQIELAPRFLVRATVRDTTGLYEDLDPRSSDLRLAITDARGARVDVVIPADDPGWRHSRPAKRRFIWRGRLGGVRQVVLRDRSRKAARGCCW